MFMKDLNIVDVVNIVEALKDIKKWDKWDTLRFEDLTPEQVESITWKQWEEWPRWPVWPRWEFSDLTREQRNELTLKFSHLTEQDKDELRLRFEHLTETQIDELKLKFKHLTKEDKEELRLKFEHLTEDNKKELKWEKWDSLRFQDLTKEQKLELKWEKWDKGDTWDDWLSAYELAKKNWFKGTEAQWLSSLKGRDWQDWKSIQVTKQPLEKHKHATWDITWLQEYVEDTIWGSLVAWTNITIAYDDNTWETTINSLWWGWASSYEVTQNLHWFIELNWLYFDESDNTYKKAQSNAEATLWAWHVVEVVDANTFKVAKDGVHEINNVLALWEYVLSDTTAWWYTQTLPSGLWEYVLYWMEVISATHVSFYTVPAITVWDIWTNTWDQNLFSTIAVDWQSNIVADSTSDILTLVAWTNITITTDAATDAITINSTWWGWSWDVTKVWTPVNNQIWVWTWDWTIEWDVDLTFDTTTNTLSTVNISVSWTVDWRDIATDWNKLDWIESWAEVNNISDTNATDLTDWGDTTLHTHDWRYYTESEVDTLLSWKANTSHTHIINDVTWLQTALDWKVDENAAITWATKTKITYDAKGLVTAWADATTADIADSLNKRYVTDAQLTILWNTSWTNTGDQTSIVWITWSKTQFNTALSDWDFLFVWDITQYTDELAQDAIGAMIDSSLVYVDWTPLLQRAALTWAITASAWSNTTSLGSFTVSQLNTALSDWDVATGWGTATWTNTWDQNLFSTITVSWQSNIVADSTSDTLTLVAGTNVTITTDAWTDTITINASWGWTPWGSDTQFQYNNWWAFGWIPEMTWNDTTKTFVVNTSNDSSAVNIICSNTAETSGSSIVMAEDSFYFSVQTPSFITACSMDSTGVYFTSTSWVWFNSWDWTYNFWESTGTYNWIFDVDNITANRTFTFPNASWTIALTSDLSSYLPLAWWTLTWATILAENASLQLDWSLSADGKWSGTTITWTAWYTQAFWDLVYLDPTDSRWEATDANAAAWADWDCRWAIWMVVSAWTDWTACTILLQGTIRADANFPTFTVWWPIFASETAWDVTQTAPTTSGVVVKAVWRALTADSMYFNPSANFTIVT